jgi:hypothetical protein
MPHIPVFMTPDEHAALEKASEDVRSLIDAVEETFDQCVHRPVPASAVEVCSMKDPEGWWLMYAQFSINVGIDHLRTLLAAWAAPRGLPHAAGYTLIRGATEAAARACWLVDSSLIPRERTARGILERQYTIGRLEQLKVEGNSQHIQQRRAGFAATIASAGFTVTGRKCESQERPGITRLMKSLLTAPTQSGAGTAGELAYSLLSGYAHAETWVLLMDMKPVGSGMSAVDPSVSRQILLLRVAALRLLHTAVCWVVELAGLDVSGWKRSALPWVFGA